MDKFWESYWDLQIEANLVLMKYQGWFYQVDPLRLFGLLTVSMKVLERLIIWVIQKEIGLEIN